MEISNSSHIASYHPVGVQAGLKTEAEIQNRGADSVPPPTSSSSSSSSNTSYDNTSGSGGRLDVRA